MTSRAHGALLALGWLLMMLAIVAPQPMADVLVLVGALMMAVEVWHV